MLSSDSIRHIPTGVSSVLYLSRQGIPKYMIRYPGRDCQPILSDGTPILLSRFIMPGCYTHTSAKQKNKMVQPERY